MSNTDMDIDGTGTDIDDGTNDGADPDAGLGPAMVTGKVVVTRKPKVYALDETMAGFKGLQDF
jgi:hypothetical protein